EQRQHGLPHGAADVLEIDVDPVRTRSRKLFGKVGCTMVDRGIEPEIFEDGAALFGTAGDADRFRAGELGELPDQRAARSARGRSARAWAGRSGGARHGGGGGACGARQTGW